MNLLKILIIGLFLYGFLFRTTNIEAGNRSNAHEESLYKLLARRQSPLMASASEFLRIAAKYKLDWKILPAIAGVESGFETNGDTTDYNPFGYMCGAHPCVFDSYSQAIERVAKTISRSESYKDYRDTKSLYVLAEKYNYVSPEDWASKVEYFEGKLK